MKYVMIVLGALLACVIMIMPISALMVRQGLKHRDKDWADDMVFRGAGIRMKLFQYGTARKIMTKGLEVFPKYKHKDNIHFKIALCHEKTGNKKAAMAGYQSFIANWPNHEWADQAKRKIDLMKAENM